MRPTHKMWLCDTDVAHTWFRCGSDVVHTWFRCISHVVQLWLTRGLDVARVWVARRPRWVRVVDEDGGLEAQSIHEELQYGTTIC